MELLDINIADIVTISGLIIGIVFVAWELMVRHNIKKLKDVR